MAFVLLGLALLAMKVGEIGPVAGWAWYVVLAPFGLAVLWWSFADSSGLTQRRAIDKMDKRKAERRQRDMDALGLTPTRDKQVRRAQAKARATPPASAPAPASATRTPASGSAPESGHRHDPEL
jgi:small Trp-rich protein